MSASDALKNEARLMHDSRAAPGCNRQVRPPEGSDELPSPISAPEGCVYFEIQYYPRTPKR